MYLIFLYLRIHDNSLTIPLPSVARVGLVAERLDARSPVGCHFLIVVPYSSYLTESFILLSIHKGGVGRIYSQSKGCGQGKIFSGAPCFAPPIKNPGGATDHKHYLSQYGQRNFGEFAIFLSLPQCNIPIPCNSIVDRVLLYFCTWFLLY